MRQQLEKCSIFSIISHAGINQRIFGANLDGVKLNLTNFYYLFNFSAWLGFLCCEGDRWWLVWRFTYFCFFQQFHFSIGSSNFRHQISCWSKGKWSNHNQRDLVRNLFNRWRYLVRCVFIVKNKLNEGSFLKKLLTNAHQLLNLINLPKFLQSLSQWLQRGKAGGYVVKYHFG